MVPADDDDGAPKPPNDVPERVSVEVLRAFLSLKTTVDRVYQVVEARVRPGAPAVIDDIAQEALVRALTTESRPESESKMLAWISTVAQHTVGDYFRRNKVALKWLDPDVSIDDLPGTVFAPVRHESAAIAMVGPWLRDLVAKRPRDRVTYEMMCQHGIGKKTYEQLAAQHDTTADAVAKRIQRFKERYIPLRQRYVERRRMILLLLVGGLLIAIALAWLLWPSPRSGVVPDRSVAPRTRPSPTASASGFNQALPPPSSTVDPDGKRSP